MLYVTHERNDIENGSNVDVHLFDPSTSTRGVLRTITLDSTDGQKRDRTKREQEWIRSSLKEELGKLSIVAPSSDRS